MSYLKRFYLPFRSLVVTAATVATAALVAMAATVATTALAMVAMAATVATTALVAAVETTALVAMAETVTTGALVGGDGGDGHLSVGPGDSGSNDHHVLITPFKVCPGTTTKFSSEDLLPLETEGTAFSSRTGEKVIATVFTPVARV
eukprot:TRINITY_DN10061_c0_g1_i14.p1 TRINITY_DN10061_c0_g1~~TRINITY_DN10061_c0_g1_i14.p1  ORF type:complete len:147 (+),score=27.38 TRINITY_DN10061_c0_g1_i14:296-736(+)